MFSIMLREFRDRRISLAAYCGIMVALLVIYIALYPSIKDSLDQFQQIYESYPKSFYQALGIENLSVNTLENYLSIEMYSIVWQILALLLAGSLAGFAIAGQIEKGTIGYYLALPVSRAKLYSAKFGAGLAGLLIFVAVSVGGTIPLAAIFGSTISTSGVWNLSILSLLFALVVYSFAMLLSALFSERSKVYMIMGGLLIAMYAMNIIASLKTNLAWLENYSLFHYYNAQTVLTGGSLAPKTLIIFGGLSLIFALCGLAAFRRRDISV